MEYKMNEMEIIEMEMKNSSDVLLTEEEQSPIVEEEKKPLMVWFDAFEVELEKLGGDYKNIEPTDVLELYYEGVTPEDSASKLMLESKNNT